MWQLIVGGLGLVLGSVGLSLILNKFKLGKLDKAIKESDEKHEEAVEKINQSNIVVAKLEQKAEDLKEQREAIVDKPLDPTVDELNNFFKEMQKKTGK